MNFLKDKCLEFFPPCAIGVAAFWLTEIITSSLMDSLLISLVFGMIIGSIFRKKGIFSRDFSSATAIFIPLGAVIYGAVNLDFMRIGKIDPSVLILLLLVIAAYFFTILIMGNILDQRKKITYLTATGSAICGASAIAISAPAVEAEPDDVSISLVSVFIAAIFGLFILFPFLAGLLGLSDYAYALLSGMTLQFTGFVKVAVADVSKDMAEMALSIKATRYLVLLASIPIFSSLVKRRVHAPWFLWAFFAAGLIFSFFPILSQYLGATLKVMLTIFWSIAMAGIGLNADPRALISDNGLKALGMAFAGFAAAVIVFLIGISVIS